MDVQSKPETKVVGSVLTSHKITITDLAGAVTTIWWAKKTPELPDFSKRQHATVVEVAHAKSGELPPGGFLTFRCQGHDYHMAHVGEREFTLKVLS